MAGIAIPTEKQLFSNRQLRSLIIPLIIEQALALSVGMIDTIMISSVGEAQVSGVSLVDMINNLIINVFSALATGGTVIVAQFLGAKEHKKAQQSAAQLLVVAFLIALAVMGGCLLWNESLISLFFGQIEADVRQASVTYFQITALSFPFIAVYNCCAALFRAIGNSRVAMYASAFSNILNLIGNYVMIHVLAFGVAGAAAATTFARFAAMLFMMVLLSNQHHAVYINWRERFHFDFSLVRRILYIGIPSGVENCVFQLGRVLVVSIIAGFGTVQIAANAVANTVDSVGCIMGQSMALAILTVVGQCVGAGDYDVVKYYIRKCMKWVYVMGGIWNGLSLLLLPQILQLFNLSPDTYALATTLIWIHNGLAIIFWPTSFSFPNALRAANDVRFTMTVSMISMFVCRISLSIVLGQWLGLGAIGVWIGMVIDWLARCTAFLLRYRSGKWMKYRKE